MESVKFRRDCSIVRGMCGVSILAEKFDVFMICKKALSEGVQGQDSYKSCGGEVEATVFHNSISRQFRSTNSQISASIVPDFQDSLLTQFMTLTPL